MRLQGGHGGFDICNRQRCVMAPPDELFWHASSSASNDVTHQLHTKKTEVYGCKETISLLFLFMGIASMTASARPNATESALSA
jgi:hypothetical protein